jgi:hypothetical protein
MRVDVDETRADDTTTGVDDLGPGCIQVLAYRCDGTVANYDIGNACAGWVDDCPALDDHELTHAETLQFLR